MRHLRSFALLVVSFGAFAAVAAWVGAIKSGDDPAKSPQPKVQALQDGPRWWKGNLHTHSLWSDGDDYPEMIALWYQSKGYNFLTLSDHNILSDGEKWTDAGAPKSVRATATANYLAAFGPGWVERRTAKVTVKSKEKDDKGKETGKEVEKDVMKDQVRLKPLREFRSLLEKSGSFLLIPGEEITHSFAKKPVHMGGINLRDVITPVSAKGVLETIAVNARLVEEQRKKTGWPNLTILNHPNFGWGVTAEEMLAPELKFFEVFNGHPGVANVGDEIHPSTDRMWDILLALRLGPNRLPPVLGVATDDAHNYFEISQKKANAGRGWIMVKAPHLTAEAIVQAMHAGDFYGSSGVTLNDIVPAKDRLTLKISPDPGVKYKTTFYVTDRGASLESEEVLNKDKAPITRKYGDGVGRVAAESDALEPSYAFTGKELYVRAKIVSSRPHPNPHRKDEFETAWTQPVVFSGPEAP